MLGIDEDAAAGPSAAGSVTLYDAQRPYHAANLGLAQLVQRDVLASLSADGTAVPDLGVHNDVGYGDLAAAGAQAYGHLTLLGPAKRARLARCRRAVPKPLKPVGHRWRGGTPSSGARVLVELDNMD